jgi:DNA-binding beta-propeller fold protein YncE/mono/diheme cytochrome c family protein
MMRNRHRRVSSCAAALLLAAGMGLLPPVPTNAATSEAPLSPCSLALSPDQSLLYVACATGNEILLLDAGAGKPGRRIAVPGSPSGLVLSVDGARLYVTCAGPESDLCVLDTRSLKITGKVACGHTAMAPVLTRDEKTAYVCDRFNDAIGIVDLDQRKEVARVPVEREPVAAALTPDGALLFVANHIHGGRSDVGVVAASVSVIDTAARKEIKRLALCNGSTLLRGICVSPDGRFVAVVHTLARFHLPTTHVTHGWMNDNALSLIDVAELKVLNTVLLDDVERGAANPWAVAWSGDGQRLVVAHAGTHELSRVDAPGLLAKLQALPVRADKPAASGYAAAAAVVSDVPNDLAFLVGLRTRIKLPGNGPRALTLAGDRAFVAQYFSDSIVSVDLGKPSPEAAALPLRTKPLELSLARKGEMYFNDGTLCYQHWQSCASCHSSEARVDGMNWDLLNDGIGNPKNVKSLLLAFETGPAMAMGVRANAGLAVRAGIQHILFAVLPEEYPAAIDEYLKSLKPIPSPHLVKGKLTPAAERGKKLFFSSEAACTRCHQPPLFTDMKAHEVGTGKFDQRTDQFHTPTLVELWRTAPYLHDGSAATVREVLANNPHDRRGKTSHLSPEQLDDLAAYLLSL